MATIDTRYLCLLSLVLLGLLPASAAVQAANPVERDGFIFFEAESGTLLNSSESLQSASSNWLWGTELPSYSGDAYLEWGGSNHFDVSGAGQDTIVYRFDITNPGNYELRWRTQIAKGDSNTEANDTWLRFLTAANVAGEEPMYGWTKVYMGHSGAWFWDAKIVDHTGANVRQYLSAGTHTLEISGRSNGHAVDKIALYKYEDLSLSPNDLDTRSGTPRDSIAANQTAISLAQNEAIDNNQQNLPSAAREVASGVQYTPGECAGNTLALVPVADIQMLGTQVFNLPSMQLAPEPARALFEFDLTAVGVTSSAELQLSIDAGGGVTTLNYFLATPDSWVEHVSGINPAPENLNLLGSATLDWSAGTRYAFSIDPQDLSASVVSIAMDAENMPATMSVASRENSLHMPLMILSGNDDFCDLYYAAKGVDEVDGAGSNGSPEDENTSDGSSHSDTTASESTADNSAQDNDGSSTDSSADSNAQDSADSNAQTNTESADKASGDSGSGGGSPSPFWLLAGVLALANKRKNSLH